MFGSEYWELKKTERKLIERFNAKALKWNCGNMNNIDSVFSTNLLPPLCYHKVSPKRLLTGWDGKLSPKRLFKGWAETYTWRLQHRLSGDLVLYTSFEGYHL